VNSELAQLASTLRLAAPESRELALKFCLACAKRVEHLLEEPEVIECLRVLERYVEGNTNSECLAQAAEDAALLASRHRGSKSIDGCGHAAVSASYGVSKAVAGKALDAAQYCAYASVYASGGYAAVAELEAFEPEFSWQLACLTSLFKDASIGSAAIPVFQRDHSV
jgi:hypothetical protein